MRDIYRGAQRTLAWIGPETEGSELVINEFEKYAALDAAAEPVQEDEILERMVSRGDIMTAITNFAISPYWRRGWIIQELTGSRNAIVLYGKRSIPWRRLVQGFKVMTSATLHQPESMQTVFGELSWLFKLSEGPDWDSGNAKKTSILEHLHNYRHWQFTNPLDQIYAFLGLPCREDVSTFPID